VNTVRITSDPFDPTAETGALRDGNARIGAIVTFLGLMRDINEGVRVSRMFLEHYPGMTEKALQDIVDDAGSRWDVQGVRVVHRVGEIRPEEPIVLVAVASRHRGEAFRACEFVIDYLKTRAPFWKKEITDRGERWVDARVSDEKATARWRDD
jgi:molybdopterin synthase catalytic subunit